MIWVVTLALIATLMLVAVLSVLLFYLFRESVRALTASHARTTTYTEGLIDRIVSGDWQTYKTYQMMEPMGGVVEEEEPEEPTTVMGPDRGGFGSRLGLGAYRAPVDLETVEEDLSSELP